MEAFRRNNMGLPIDDPRVMHSTHGKDPISYQHPAHPSSFSPHPPPPPHARPATYMATTTAPSAPPKLIHPSRTITGSTSSHASKQNDDDDELEVIGSGISDAYRRDKHAVPLVLPNLKYDLSETTVQNYSPGTSLVFNAYKGHAALLAQPYHAPENSDAEYRDYRAIHPSERGHPQHTPSHAYPGKPSVYPDYHDELERRARYNEWMDREPRDQRGPDDRAPPPEYYQHSHPPRSQSPSRNHPHSHPSCPPMHASYHERDHPMEGTQYSTSHYSSRSDPYHPHHEEPWASEHRRYSAAIDIPKPNGRFPLNYNRPASGTQGNYRDIERNTQHSGRHPNYQPYDRSSQTMPPGSRAPTGPRYALSQINYRMIYEYAREVHDCLIKGKVGSTDRLLYNAEILSKVFMGCRVDQDAAEIAEDETAVNPHQPRCASCNIVKTPEWRKGPLGPRTLCNACGLIWGKMSRSKAALAKAAKQAEAKDDAPPKMPEASGSQSSPVLDDTHMSDISPTHLDTDKDPMDVSRKRARDPTPVEPEIDELEDDSSLDGDVNIKEEVIIPVEGLHISSSTPSSELFPSSSAPQASVSPRTPGHTTISSSMHQRQHQHMLPLEVPSDTMALSDLGQAPVTGKKLALSYLLD